MLNTVNQAINLFLPHHCHHCARPGISIMCRGCIQSIQPSPQTTQLDDQLRVQSFFKYDGALKTMLHQLKFESAKPFDRPLKRLIRKRIMPEINLSGFDTILSVPIHPKRAKARGFNPVDRLFDTLNLSHCVNRRKNTPPLFELSAPDRKTTLTNAFEVIAPDQISNRQVLIVDDIFTTGATITEIAKTLHAYRPKRIQGLTLCYTPVQGQFDDT